MKYIKNFQLSLVDTDFEVRTKVDYIPSGPDDPIEKFIQESREKLVPGQTAHLEIKGFDMEPVAFKISRADRN